MNYRPTRSTVRRLSPLFVIVVGVLAFFGHLAAANAGTPEGNQIVSCQSYGGFSSYYFSVNGKKIAETPNADGLRGKTKPGDTLSLTFTLFSGCTNLYVGLDSYTSNGPAVTSSGLNHDQTLYKRDASTFAAGSSHTISVAIPNCYYQVDAYTGGTFKLGDYTNSGGPGFISSDYGGTNNQCSPATTTAPVKKPTTTTTVKPTTTTVKPTTTTMKPTTTTTAPAATTTTMKPTTTTTEQSVTSTTMKPTTTTTEKPTTTTVKPTTTTAKPTTTTTEKAVTTTTAPAPVIKNSASITQVCKVGANGWSVTYTNSGSTTQTFVLSSGTNNIDTVQVQAGKSTTKSYSFSDNNVAAGKPIDLVVKVGSTQIEAATITNDCYNESAVVVAQCNTSVGTGAVFTFTNNGKVDETFDVTDSNGKALSWSPVTVKVGDQPLVKTQVVADNAQTDFTVKAEQSGITTPLSVKTSCVQVEATTVVSTTIPPTTTTVAPQVLGETVTKPALAFTGLNVFPLIIGGSALLVLGGAFVLGSRRQRLLND